MRAKGHVSFRKYSFSNIVICFLEFVFKLIDIFYIYILFFNLLNILSLLSLVRINITTFIVLMTVLTLNDYEILNDHNV